MSLKNIGELGKFVNNLNTLKKGSSEWKDAFASIRKSLDGLTVDEALEKLQKLKVNPELQEGLLKSAKRADILKGTTEEIEDGIKKVGQSSSYIDDLGLAFKGLGQSIKTGLSSLWSFAVANPVIAGVAAIGVAMIGAMLISDKFIETYDEASEKAKESADAYNTTKLELESLDSELKTTKDRLEELQKLQDGGTITVAEEEELKRLQVTNEELQREYNIKKKLAELQKEQASKDAENALNKLDASVASTYDDKGNKYHEGSKIYDANVQGMTDADALEASIAKVKEYREEIVKLQEKQANAKNQKQFDKIQKDIDKYQSAIDDMESDMGTRAQNISDNLQSISNKDSELYKKNSKVVEEYLNMNSSSTADELERINDALEKIDEATLNKNVNESFDTIKKSYKAVQEFKKAMSEGMTESALNGVAELSDELKAMVAEFHSGMVSADELYQALNDHYNVDLKNYADAIIAKNQYSEQFYNKVGLANAEFTNSMLENYGVDISNCKTYNEARLRIEQQTLNTLGKMWSKYYNAQTKSYTSEMASLGRQIEQRERAGQDASALRAIAQQVGAQARNYESAVAALDKVVYSGITSNFEGISNNISGGAGKSGSSQVIDWIEIAISRLQRTITNLGKTVSATWKSWTDRNSALKSQISSVTQEINLQANAANKYLSLANSVGLGEGYKSLVRNGTLDISTITDENTINAIKQYQEWYEAYLSALDAKQEAEDELANLAQTQFDNVAKQYDDRLSVIKHETNLLNGTIDILENKGYLASAKLYDSLIQNEQERLSELQAKYTSLNSAMSGISQGTEQWYEMYAEVLSVKEEIQDATNAMIEFNNSIRDLEWEVFDILQDRMSTVISEAEFLIELMSDEKMFDDNGITEHGQATLGLHAVNYNVYMSQADEYKKALEELDEAYANDSLNQDYLERRDELLEQHRDMILSAESEKEALKDLMSQGYDTLLESMQKIIDKRKEMMNQMKDLYDYEKSVSEQTKEIANLEKQLSAYQGDNSEESRATIQQIKVSLEKAKENLQETEYDKYISDQQQMLDLLQEETELWINERLDNEDLLLQNIIDSINGDSGSIKATLQAEAKEVGITLSDKMESIFSPNGTFTSVVSTYSGQFTNKLTTVNDTLTQIKNLVDHMVKDADAEAAKQQAQSSKPTTSTPSTSGGGSSSSSSSSSSGSISSGKSGWEQYLIYKADSYPKSKLSINSSIVDRLKYNNFASDFNTRAKLYSAMGGSGAYVGSSSQNVFMLNKMKSAGYKVGSSNIPYNQSNWIHEDELVYRASDGGLLMPLGSGDKVFTKEMSDKLWNMAQIDWKPTLPRYDFSNLGVRGMNKNIVNHNTFEFNLEGVKNHDEFITELQHSKRFENIILEITDGDNGLTKYKW